MGRASESWTEDGLPVLNISIRLVLLFVVIVFRSGTHEGNSEIREFVRCVCPALNPKPNLGRDAEGEGGRVQGCQSHVRVKLYSCQLTPRGQSGVTHCTRGAIQIFVFLISSVDCYGVISCASEMTIFNHKD